MHESGSNYRPTVDSTSEKLIPGSGLRPVTITRDREEPIVGFGREDKRVVHAHVGRKPVSFVEREYTGIEHTYLNKWKKLRERGLPVVPTLRISERGSIMLTNLKADGSDLYGKGKGLKLEESPLYKLTPTDRQFIQVWKRQKAEIQAAARQLAEYATSQHVLLPTDDAFELDIHPDGSWELIVVDMTWVAIDTNDDFEFFNTRSTEMALKDLDRLSRRLESKISPLHRIKNLFLGLADAVNSIAKENDFSELP